MIQNEILIGVLYWPGTVFNNEGEIKSIQKYILFEETAPKNNILTSFLRKGKKNLSILTKNILLRESMNIENLNLY